MTNPSPCEIVERLKPCPFCGAEAALHRSARPCGYGYHTHWVACSNFDDGCAIATPNIRRPEDAIAAWNRRAPDPALEASLQQAREELDSSSSTDVATSADALTETQHSAGREVDLAELHERILTTNPLLPNDMARLNGYIDALVDNENEAWPPNYTGCVDTLQALARRLGLDERGLSAAALDAGEVDPRPLSLLYAAVMVRRLIERDGQTFTPPADAQWSRLTLSSGSPPISPSEASAATSVADEPLSKKGPQ